MFECFHMWDIINSIARNTGVCVSFQVSIFTFSGYVPRSRIAGSYGCPIFRFLWKLHTDFHSGWINNLHCPRVFKWFLSPYPLKLLIFIKYINILVIATLTDVSWCCITVLSDWCVISLGDFFGDRYSDRCELILHYCFNLHFSVNRWYWASFLVLLAICVFYVPFSANTMLFWLL